MRETRYYGNTLGAIEVELRKGAVNKIILGTVKRFSADEQAMGAPLLTFTPVLTITGDCTKRALRIGLSQARAIYRENGPESGMTAYDAVVRSAVA